MQTQPTIAELDSALHTMLDENEALRAELIRLRDEVKQLVDWINGDRDALTCLQSVYNDPKASEANRVKAAASALPFERPKLTFNVQVGPAVLGQRLDQARMKTEPKVIEHQAAPVRTRR